MNLGGVRVYLAITDGCHEVVAILELWGHGVRIWLLQEVRRRRKGYSLYPSRWMR